MSASTGRLVILSGPSCAGKSPLVEALGREDPSLADSLQPLVLYNDRAPRPGETDGEDYHFRTREEIEALRKEERYIVLEVRNDLQALDTKELAGQLEKGEVLFEGNPFVGETLLKNERLAEIPTLSVFLSPLGEEEIRAMSAPEQHIDVDALIAEIMRRKLLRRTRRQMGKLSEPDLADIETRCTSAPGELRKAWRFDHVLVNHDGEDHEHWWAFPLPLGDARRAVMDFRSLLRGETCPRTEHWEKGLLGEDDS